MRAATALALIACAALWGCSAKAPKGIDAALLDDGIANTIGDPTTCVLVVKKGSGEVVYRYGSHMTCGTSFPSCQAGGTTSGDDLAKAAASGEVRSASCGSPAGGVGYVIGPVPTSKAQYSDLAYSASMNTKRMLPGVEMASRLAQALSRAGF
jgi:hypothetical protein